MKKLEKKIKKFKKDQDIDLSKIDIIKLIEEIIKGTKIT